MTVVLSLPSRTVTLRPAPEGNVMLTVDVAVLPRVLVAVKSNEYVAGELAEAVNEPSLPSVTVSPLLTLAILAGSTVTGRFAPSVAPVRMPGAFTVRAVATLD